MESGQPTWKHSASLCCRCLLEIARLRLLYWSERGLFFIYSQASQKTVPDQFLVKEAYLCHATSRHRATHQQGATLLCMSLAVLKLVHGNRTSTGGTLETRTFAMSTFSSVPLTKADMWTAGIRPSTCPHLGAYTEGRLNCLRTEVAVLLSCHTT